MPLRRAPPGIRAAAVGEWRVEVRPAWTFRLAGGSANGLTRHCGATLQRLLHTDDDAPVHVAVAQPARDRVVFAARATRAEDAYWAIARMRFATGVDDDLRPFYRAFADDPVIGQSVRCRPELRLRRTPLPWESLFAAICEQLIEFERAIAIQRRMIAAHGRTRQIGRSRLRDLPTAAAVAALSPAEIASFALAPNRSLTLRRAAGAVACGKIDLSAEDPYPGWRALRAIPGIGPWTLEILATYGQGHYDRIAAGDVGYLKLVGRVLTGNPCARVDPPTVYEFFERYAGWQGLAGEHLRLAFTGS